MSAPVCSHTFPFAEQGICRVWRHSLCGCVGCACWEQSGRPSCHRVALLGRYLNPSSPGSVDTNPFAVPASRGLALSTTHPPTDIVLSAHPQALEDMSCSASAQSSGLFSTTAPTAPHAFNIFSFSHSPRETHAMAEDLRDVLRPSNQVSEWGVETRKTLRRASSTPSLKDSIRKFFRL